MHGAFIGAGSYLPQQFHWGDVRRRRHPWSSLDDGRRDTHRM